MFTALNLARTARYALPCAPTAQQEGALLLNGAQARAMSSELRCEEVHCDAPVFFRQPADRAPHWFHAAGTAGDCAAMGGPAGEFHRHLQFDLFGAAFAHEFSVPGARADVIVQRISSKKSVAIEIQHSPIDPVVVLRRHAAHQAAGIMGTVWIINSADVQRAPGSVILTSWVVDLLEACQNTPDGYPCTVLIYKDRRHVGGGETFRIIDRAEIGHDAQGRRTAAVELNAGGNISGEALRLFAAGKDRPRVIPAELEASVRALDSAPTRRVKKAMPQWQPAAGAA